MLFRTCILAIMITAFPIGAEGAASAEQKQPVVNFHLSFENTDFFTNDLLAQSGKKTIEERKIEFPPGKFGRGIRMNHIPGTPDIDNMSGIDLDMITSLIFNTRPHTQAGFNEPFFWGSGKLNPRLGAAAFWAKGKPPFTGPLFEQTSNAFGRKERDLLAVNLDEQGKISAFVRDARYTRHELKTDIIWNASTWNHVVFNWDWANGLELWLNGKKIASSWGKDPWFETMYPGLFHLPTAGIIYDELYLMDRPLTPGEIKNLMLSNKAPSDEAPAFKRTPDETARMYPISGADYNRDLPTAVPASPLLVREIWPTGAADGKIPGWFVLDGRNELAWPLEYAFFTIIPGDGDFHAEKVDISTKPDSEVNYIVLTGNLTDVKMQAGSCGMKDAKDVLAVPRGERFMYGKTVEAAPGSTFRIPFVVGYGAPPGFQGDVHLPLTGGKRIQDVGLYRVEAAKESPDGDRMILTPFQGSLGAKYDFSFKALTARDERTVVLASAQPAPASKPTTVNIGGFRRLNIWSEPFSAVTGVGSVTLSLPIKTLNAEEALFFRVHDPSVPSRLWNQFALNLKGFNIGSRILRLTLDFQDLMLAAGERLWIDMGSAGPCEISLEDRQNPAAMVISKVVPYIAVDAYAEKEIVAADAQYAKMYEFMPWKFNNTMPSLDQPYSFSGPFDILFPAQAIKRFKPDHFTANFMEIMAGPFYSPGGTGWPTNPSNVELKTLKDPYGAPDWAVYMRDYQTFRHRIADWWRENQNPDSQVGGGWNDDTLFMSFHMADLPLDGNRNAKAIIDSVHTCMEYTRLFKDGYCQIYPIDRLHTGDFISERYNTVVNNFGQAYPAEREMESAWHSGHPERTPLNYGNGGAFKSSVNVFNWYWGIDIPKEPYISKPLTELTKEMRLYASCQNDYTFYRYTMSHVHTDDYTPYGSYETYRYLLGGDRGARWDAHLKLAVMWPSGGGPDVSRLILKADDTSLEAVCYSFDNVKRDLQMRFCRIQDGRYRVSILKDPGGIGKGGEPLWQIESELSRFDVVTLPVPPHTPVVIRVEQIKAHPRPATLPDLAIDPWDASLKGSTVTAVIHNLGNAPAKNVVVRLVEGERTLQEKTIDSLEAPLDFRAKRTTVTFTGITPSRNLQVIVDPANGIPEILKENNRATVRKQ